ncbi:hypothetical protein LY90DRAFT_700142 [Neocallimastix californiae]|jgi:hypothetical protein|uniref:BZIP domain-containing protein n=1 Tax=Neocallimastix californiae TaxID=1754190 RepID=A0A1Y2EGI3_9FUNG|nr:hypothetical protein LY90DRAFT_700142 [Neocallimastix californiae]|eukprot:ORY70682.1 hypothetical protein LY90DRAFT_700142 [Neocallimastix californiae]
MSAIQQPVAFDNFSYGQQTILADGSVLNNQGNNMVYNGQATTIQTFDANQTTFQNNNNSAQLISQAQPTVVNTTTYLQTPTYSPQGLNETTNSNLILNNATVTVTTPTSASVTANAISSQPINIPNQQNQFYGQTISPVEGNGMNFFPSLPINENMKNGQILSPSNTTPTTYTTTTTVPQSNDQRYPSPPMGAVDINKNQCQPMTITAPIQSTTFTTTSPINIVNSTQANGFISQTVPVNQGTITQAQPNGSMNINMGTASYPQQNNGFQQYYNQSFTQTIQGKGQQQTIISSTTNIASNYPPQANLTNGLNGKIGQGNLITVNPPMTIKKNSRSKSNEPISLELALKRQKNTEAARRSRMRKVLKMETLENHVKRLEGENKNLSIRLAMLESNRIEWESKEKKLLDKIKDLEEQLAEARKGQSIKSEENNMSVKVEELSKE